MVRWVWFDVAIAIAVLLQIFSARFWRAWGAIDERRRIVAFFQRTSFVLTMGEAGPAEHVLNDPNQVDGIASLLEHETDRFWTRQKGYLPHAARERDRHRVAQARRQAEDRLRRGAT